LRVGYGRGVLVRTRIAAVRSDTIPILDPRAGDAEDDASSTKGRSLLGIAPLWATIWFTAAASRLAHGIYGITPVILLALLALLGWLGGRRVLRLAEEGFWSLNGLVVQPPTTRTG